MKIDLKRAVEVLEACGYECEQLTSRDAEIAELKVVSDHNLHIYQEAASKMRAEIANMQEQIETLEREIDARDSWKDIIKERDQLHEQVDEKETQRQNLMAAYERQGNSAQEVITTLRERVTELQGQVGLLLRISKELAATKDVPE